MGSRINLYSNSARKYAVSISQEALFKIALNLEDPWYITLIDFSAEGKQLDVHVDFESGSKFPCAKCGKTECSVHDTIERTWRHLNFFQLKTYIRCRVPRTECKDCGVKQVAPRCFVWVGLNPEV